MNLTNLLRLPLTGPRLAIRALDDLSAIAEHARAQPDAIEQITQLLSALLIEIAAVNVVAGEIVTGGADLNQTGRQLDRDAVRIVDGGEDLVDVARSLDETLNIFRQHLPRLLQGLDTVEELEGAAETMADTLEPLQGAAKRVGRLTDRVSRS